MFGSRFGGEKGLPGMMLGTPALKALSALLANTVLTEDLLIFCSAE